MSGFKAFLLRGNVVDLAVAVVVGAAFGALVNAMVKDLVTPLIAALVGKPDFGGLYFTIHNSRFQYGDFLNAVITFVIIAAVVYYLVVVPYTKFRGLLIRPATPEPQTRECPECLSKIPARARRCAHCTAVLPAAT
jgi:large conductance mechanosensitive channel